MWLVCQEETPHNTVLGVFASQSEAAGYADEVSHLYEDGVSYASFPLGYRHIDGSAPYLRQPSAP